MKPCVCIILLEHQFNYQSLNILSYYLGLLYLQVFIKRASPKFTFWSSELGSHLWINLITSTPSFRGRMKHNLSLEPCKFIYTWTWLVFHNYLSFVIIKRKLVVEPLGQQSPPFDDDKTHELLRIDKYRELEKLSLKLCLYIKFNHTWLKDIVINKQVICI